MTPITQEALAAACTCPWRRQTFEEAWVTVEEPIVLCPKHERMLRPLRWDTLATMVVDFMESSPSLPAQPDPALDVERLARAMAVVDPDVDLDWQSEGERAAGIAAAYDADKGER